MICRDSSPEELSLRHFFTWFLASGPLQLKSGDCGPLIVDGDCFSQGLAGGLFVSKGMESVLVLLAAVAFFSSGCVGWVHLTENTGLGVEEIQCPGYLAMLTRRQRDCLLSISAIRVLQILKKLLGTSSCN